MKMKSILAGLLLLGSLSSAFAQLTIPSDGSDGAFSPAANIEIDLSQAISGTWSNNNSANAGKGIYDAQKWAIVFKYASVNVPAGVTVTFKNHPTYAPVVWLVQGSVSVAGTVSVDGRQDSSGPNAAFPTEPGPGGFRGGAAGPSGTGVGLGPGATANHATYNTTYGNPQILPLIGGSGGGGYSGNYSGTGAGGAILVAAPGTVQVTGSITARAPAELVSYHGSGGAIKLIANQIAGTGSLNAATSGRVRIEANSLAATIAATPACGCRN